MRAGGKGFGVTIHELSDRFDAGDILAQKSLPYPAGAAESELEPTVAAAGAMLAATVVTRLATGSVERTPQDPRLATYESWPEESDYVISTSRPARDAFVFLRGVAGRGIPVRIDAPDGSILVTDAIDFAGDPEPTPTDDPDLTVIPFQPGWLVARVKASACR
jgi:methionyl-tRNA formyltransferase